jgi:hypothetical protein
MIAINDCGGWPKLRTLGWIYSQPKPGTKNTGITKGSSGKTIVPVCANAAKNGTINDEIARSRLIDRNPLHNSIYAPSRRLKGLDTKWVQTAVDPRL